MEIGVFRDIYIYRCVIMVSKTTTYRNIAKAGQYTIFRTAIDFYVPILEKAYDFVRKYPQMPEHQFNEILQYVTWAYERIYENMYWWLKGLRLDLQNLERLEELRKDVIQNSWFRASTVDVQAVEQITKQTLIATTRYFLKILNRKPFGYPSVKILWKEMGMSKKDLFSQHEQFYKLLRVWTRINIWYLGREAFYVPWELTQDMPEAWIKRIWIGLYWGMFYALWQGKGGFIEYQIDYLYGYYPVLKVFFIPY